MTDVRPHVLDSSSALVLAKVATVVRPVRQFDEKMRACLVLIRPDSVDLSLVRRVARLSISWDLAVLVFYCCSVAILVLTILRLCVRFKQLPDVTLI